MVCADSGSLTERLLLSLMFVNCTIPFLRSRHHTAKLSLHIALKYSDSLHNL